MLVLENLGLQLTRLDSHARHQRVVEALIRHGEEQVGELENSADLELYVETENHEVVAGLIGRFRWNVLIINQLWVEPTYRGKGLGTFLMLSAEEEALKRGATVIALSTHEFNAPGLYTKLGFTLSGMVPEFPAGTNYYHFFKLIAPH